MTGRTIRRYRNFKHLPYIISLHQPSVGPFTQGRREILIIFGVLLHILYVELLDGDEMKKSISIWQLVGFGLTVLLGTLLHFLYDWTGGNVAAALFSGVNESTWEHMKLLFFPMFFFALVQSRFFKDCENFWCVKLIGILVGLSLIPVIFYTYNGVIGKSPDWVNISIFFISAAIAYFVEARLFKRNFRCKAPKFAFSLICIIGILFFVFTFATPHIDLFKDPISGGYGLSGT